MKIVLTHPYCWPHVRRGSERTMDGLGRYLTRRGHEVTTVSVHPEGARDEVSDVGRRRLYGSRWCPTLAKLRVQPTHTFMLATLQALSEIDADVVHSYYYTDGFVASRLKKRRGFVSVLQLNGAAVPTAFRRWWPPERWLVREAIVSADRFITCSRFVADVLIAHYGVRTDVIVPPVDTELFTFGDGPNDGAQVILAAADFNVPGKGLAVLVEAFALVLKSVPEARLRLSGAMSDETRRRVFAALPADVMQHIEILGLGTQEALLQQYRQASVLALPSMWEASGGVMLEAWASGTPVVATNHGGLPEFVTPEVGVLFDPETDGSQTHNASGLAHALLSGLEMAQQPGVRQRCRAHAESYSWQAGGDRYETLYTELLNGAR